MKMKSVISLILVWALLVPAFPDSAAAEAQRRDGGGTQGKGVDWKKVAIGAGVAGAAIGVSVWQNNRAAKKQGEEQQRIESEQKVALDLVNYLPCRTNPIPLAGRDVEILGLPYTNSGYGYTRSTNTRRGRQTTRRSTLGAGGTDITTEAAEATLDFLGECDANILPNPELLQIIRQQHGEYAGYGQGFGIRRYANYDSAERTDIPPFLAIVRAVQVSQGSANSDLNLGVYNRSSGQENVTVRVRIEIFERPVGRAGDQLKLVRLGSASGIGRSVVGRYLHERIVFNSSDAENRSDDYFAVLHAVFDTMSRMRWSRTNAGVIE